jgi:hypothetical protein
MTHVHHCPDCQNNWKCVSAECERYTAYLCRECFEALICLQCYKALAGDDGSTLRPELRKGVSGLKSQEF